MLIMMFVRHAKTELPHQTEGDNSLLRGAAVQTGIVYPHSQLDMVATAMSEASLAAVCDTYRHRNDVERHSRRTMPPVKAIRLAGIVRTSGTRNSSRSSQGTR